MKERITITIDKELLEWIDKNVVNKVFANRSHGLEFLIMQRYKNVSIQFKYFEHYKKIL